jgi:hypothetical protein
LSEDRVKRLMLATCGYTVEFETDMICLARRPAFERAMETQTNFALMYKMYVTLEPMALFAVALSHEDSIAYKMS